VDAVFFAKTPNLEHVAITPNRNMLWGPPHEPMAALETKLRNIVFLQSIKKIIFFVSGAFGPRRPCCNA
jgi:hypothetical protein